MIPSSKVYTKVTTKEANKEVNSSSLLLWLTTLVLLMFMAGCSALEKLEGACLDYKSFRTVVEECTPLYGHLICIDKEKTRVVCTRREDNGSE